MGRDERFAEMRRQRQQQSQHDLRRMMQRTQPAVPTEPRDRFGVPIRLNDLLIYRSDADPIFQVVDIQPVLAPNAPPGLTKVTLTVTMPIYVSTLQPAGNCIVWGNTADAEEPTSSSAPSFEVTKPEAEPEFTKASEESTNVSPLITLTD